MCTLIAAVRPDPERALVIAANRDEVLDRPAEGPKPRVFGRISVFAPLDLQGGGTWMGLSEHGLFVALTNRFGLPPFPGRRSRGDVVKEAIERPDARSAFGWAEQLDPRQEKGFHLFIADREEAFVVVANGSSLSGWRLNPGMHVITERAFEAGPSLRQARLEARFDRPNPGALTPHALAQVLAQQGEDGVCVHLPDRNYGTRSAALVELFKDPKRAPTWMATAGPPCRTEWETLEVRFSNGP